MRRVATRATTSRCAGSGTRSAIATEKPTPAESPSEHTSPSTPASDSSSSQDRHAISSATSTTSRPANAAKRRYRSTIRFRSFSSDSNRAAVENSSCGAAPEIATNSHMSRSRSNKRRTEPVGGRRDQLVERRQQLHRKRRDHPPSTSRRQHFLEAHSLVCEDALFPVYLAIREERSSAKSSGSRASIGVGSIIAAMDPSGMPAAESQRMRISLTRSGSS